LCLLPLGAIKKLRLNKPNVEISASPANGLIKTSIADCLQTRPIDYRSRLVSIRGELEPKLMLEIDEALRIVFAL
jgi:mRNA interferase MazF